MGIKKTKLIVILLLALSCLTFERVEAQYYDWGQNPASVKWMQINRDNGKFVFPETYKLKAVKLMHYMDTVHRYVGYGYSKGPLKMPLVMHTQNFQSNGIVMLAPNRMEYIVTPPAVTAAMPWLKQLAVHEYRHAVQYNNLNRGLIKILGYPLGQQGTILGLAFMSVWAMEGDAVMTETQFSSFGRGLQPSFTIDYRALALEGRGKKYRVDKYFSGSFKDHLPDHYHVGYQVASYAYTKYGENIWEKTTRYGARNPYFFFTETIALRKFYKTSAGALFTEAFEDLAKHWSSMPLTDNSSRIIETPTTSFTTYSSPVSLNDSTVVALKTDLDRSSRIVEINLNNGSERTLHRTGIINTPMTLSGGRLLWSEFRGSTFWQQRVNSVPCYYDIESGRSGKLKSQRQAQFTVAMQGGKSAFVEYDYSGEYAIVYDGWRVEMPDTISVHGLAYDEMSESFYFIALGDEGMWIGSVKSGEQQIKQLTQAGFSTIANLRAAKGRLYFNSIASGRDEAHIYDLHSQKEYQITDSRYGSFEPSPTLDPNKVIVTTYTPHGYMLATQLLDTTTMREVPFSRMPRDILNPTRIKWDVPNIDSIIVADTTSLKMKRYRKGGHLFRFHSWAPVHFEPDKLLSENNFNIHLGATLMSQNLLNSTFTTLGYKYTDEGSLFTAGLKYYGWAPKFELEAEYGTMKQLVYRPAGVQVTKNDVSLSNHFDIIARAYLPILLSSGYHSRSLVPIVEFEHLNAKLVYSSQGEPVRTRNGLQKLKTSLQYVDNVRLAHRDFLPRWGYALRVTHTMSPFNDKIGKIWSGYARMYLPGLMPHHSLMLRGAGQYHDLSRYNYSQKELLPRGANFNFVPKRYGSLAIDYQFPIWYPDGGWSGVVYFRRIRANLTYDYARYKTRNSKWQNLSSYGIDMIIDLSPLRYPASTSTAVTLKLHKPSDKKGVVLGLALTLPI